MTTTTLSSNKSSEKLFDRKLFSMMAGCLRQNGILMAMYTVGLLLATVLIEAFYASSNDPATSIFPLIGSLLSFCIVTYLVPVLLSAMLFHYLHNRLSVDFYHSMPVSRTKLFLSRYFTGLILLIAPIILSKILCTAIYLFFYTPHISAGYILLYNLSDLLFWIIMNIIVFNISCMVAVTCSNAAESIIYSIALNGLISGISFIFSNISTRLYGLYLDPSIITWGSPYGVIAEYTASNSIAWDVKPTFLMTTLIWFLIGMIAFYAALKLYQRFHSEWAQQWGRQSAFSQLMKICAGILSMYLVFVITPFDSLAGRGLFAVVIGVPLGYLLIEGITGKGFDNLGKNLKYIAAAVCLCLIVPVYLATDGFGIVNYVPQVSQIKEVEVRLYNLNPFPSYFYTDKNGNKQYNASNETYTFTSEKAKQLLTDTHKSLIENREKEASDFYSFTIDYTLSSFGRNVSRRYNLPCEQYDVLYQLMCEPEYLKQTQPIFDYSPEVLESVVCHDKTGTIAGTVSSEQYEQLLEAARTDILNLTPDALTDVSKDPIVGYLNLNVKEYDEKNGVNLELKEQLTSLTYGSSVFVLRESYHNTLNLLNELEINPQDTRLDLVKSITISMPSRDDIELTPEFRFNGNLDAVIDPTEYDDSLCWEITDPKLIAQIVDAVSLDRTSASCNQVYFNMTKEAERSDLRGQVYIENSTLLSILKGSGIQVPYLLSNQELNEIQLIMQQNGNIVSRPLETEYHLDIFDIQNFVSVAEFARQHDLDWFTGKTPEQLDAMEKTAFTYPDSLYQVFYHDMMLSF